MRNVFSFSVPTFFSEKTSAEMIILRTFFGIFLNLKDDLSRTFSPDL